MQHEITISILRQKVYAHHGVLPQERVVGANFYVSLEVRAMVSERALEEDNLDGTVNYGQLTSIVEEEMHTPSQLLEHVAHRITQRVLRDIPPVRQVTVEVEKENPPLGVQCQAVGIKMTTNR